jgi:hypothetical protein
MSDIETLKAQIEAAEAAGEDVRELQEELSWLELQQREA